MRANGWRDGKSVFAVRTGVLVLFGLGVLHGDSHALLFSCHATVIFSGATVG